MTAQSVRGNDSDTTSYLVEPRRASIAVTKFSGTLGIPPRALDKLTSTIAAFTHFVLAATDSTFCFADIQGQLACCVPDHRTNSVLSIQAHWTASPMTKLEVFSFFLIL